jgi:hypothetical protein
MAGELVLRFVVGGLVVSLFAAIGELLKPKSLAGLFGAAPSVALATMGLAWATHGGAYVSLEAKTMVLGAFAFVAYAAACVWTVQTAKIPVILGAIVSWGVWLLVALGTYEATR